MIIKEKKERVRMICGQAFKKLDIPAWWRRKDAEAEVVEDGRQDEAERKECERHQAECWACGAIRENEIQCENCGAGAENADPLLIGR